MPPNPSSSVNPTHAPPPNNEAEEILSPPSEGQAQELVFDGVLVDGAPINATISACQSA